MGEQQKPVPRLTLKRISLTLTPGSRLTCIRCACQVTTGKSWSRPPAPAAHALPCRNARHTLSGWPVTAAHLWLKTVCMTGAMESVSFSAREVGQRGLTLQETRRALPKAAAARCDARKDAHQLSHRVNRLGIREEPLTAATPHRKPCRVPAAAAPLPAATPAPPPPALTLGVLHHADGAARVDDQHPRLGFGGGGRGAAGALLGPGPGQGSEQGARLSRRHLHPAPHDPLPPGRPHNGELKGREGGGGGGAAPSRCPGGGESRRACPPERGERPRGAAAVRGSPGTAPCTLRCGQRRPGRTSKPFTLEGEAKSGDAFRAPPSLGEERGRTGLRVGPARAPASSPVPSWGRRWELPLLPAFRGRSCPPSASQKQRGSGSAPAPPFQRSHLHPHLPSRWILLRVG